MTKRLITFQIDDRLLGVDIMAIREIRAWTPATAIPHAPAFVRGVVNLRGTVLPVIDLRERLGWGATGATARHVIIVIEIAHQLHGFIVDAVNDIVTVEDGTMQPPPDLGSVGGARCIEGLIPLDDRMAMVLNPGTMAIAVEPAAVQTAMAA